MKLNLNDVWIFLIDLTANSIKSKNPDFSIAESATSAIWGIANKFSTGLPIVSLTDQFIPYINLNKKLFR
jgi:hypothetical protein